LSLAQVHAALIYRKANKAEVDGYLETEERSIEELERQDRP
jgi:hypothetical protein